MKLRITISLIVALLGLAISPYVNATVDPSYETRINKACVKSGRTKKIKDLENICACVAHEHFSSALNEPYESEALTQLNWVIEYYQETNRAKLKEIAARPENLVDFDLDVMGQCLEKIRGK